METPPAGARDAHPEKAASFLERYRQMFNKKGAHWWSIVFGYPIGRMLVLLLPGYRWITPTGLTVAGFAAKVVAAVCLYRPGIESLIAAIVALQIATILDAMDGTLARSRGLSSLVGAFLDKVLDAVGLFLICVAVGMRAYAQSGEPWLIVAACAAASAYMVLCYMYWVVKATEERRATVQSMAAEAPTPSWGEIFRDWLVGWADIVRFNEADLYLWISLFAAFDQWTYLVYLLAITQGATVIKRGVDHIITLGRRQQEMQES